MRIHAALTTLFLLHAGGPALAEGASAETTETASPSPTVDASTNSARKRVLVLDLSDTGGLGADVVKTVTGIVAVKLSEVRALDVVSGDDVRRLAELEAERQVAGCDEASCLAELAGALGAQYVVFGQVGSLGELIVVNLSLFDSDRAEAVGRATAEGRSIEQLPGLIAPALRRLLSGVVSEADLAVLPSEAPPDTTPVATASGGGGGGGFPVLPVAVASAGGALVVLGAGMTVFSFMPGVWIAEKEAAFASATDEGKATIATEARTLQETWYQSSAVDLLFYGGISTAVLGLGLAGAGIAWAVVGGDE